MLADIAIFPDPRGVDTLHVTLKATFSFAGPLTLAEEQVPIRRADEYTGAPGVSSIAFPADVSLVKPGTDVVLVGQAQAPRGRRVSELLVNLTVGRLSKTVRVIGDRVWKAGAMSAAPTRPVPFTTMPLVFERAFGGACRPPREGEAPELEARNPVGVGFRGRRPLRELDGAPLPNLEDPAAGILEAGDRSIPACFSPIAPSWIPRRDRGGTYDAAWATHRAPYLPLDFDPRFFNFAASELISPRCLEGGERVELRNVTGSEQAAFSIPTCLPRVQVFIGTRTEALRCGLDTLVLEPDQLRFSATWRGALAADKIVLQIQRVRIDLERFEVDGRSL